MAVTGWLESLRAAEKTALLQDGNSRRPASSLVLTSRFRPSALVPPGKGLSLGRQSWKGSGRLPGQFAYWQKRKLRPREMTGLEPRSLGVS